MAGRHVLRGAQFSSCGSRSGPKIVGLALITWVVAGAWAWQVQAIEWKRLDAGSLMVLHASGYELDAELFAAWARDTDELVRTFLDIKSIPKVMVYLYPREEWRRTPYEAYAQPQNRSVHFLAPWDNPYVDETWYRKNLIHELAHVALAHRMGRKLWGYRELPDWFRQGLVEYIAVMASDDQIQAAYRHYLSHMQSAVRLGNTSFLFRDNVYAWGVFTLAFFEERFGHERLLDLLGSRARTFSQAFQQVTGLSPIEFEAEWEAWIPEYVSRVDWPRATGSPPRRRQPSPEPTANIGQTTSASNKFFEISEPLFILPMSMNRTRVQIVITSKEPIARELLEGTISGPGLRPDISVNPQATGDDYATVVRVDVPVRAAGSSWISVVPITLDLQPGQTVHLVDVHGHWYPGALVWR